MRLGLMDSTLPCGYACQPSVWIQIEIFVSWFEQFIFHTKASEKTVNYKIILLPQEM